MTDLCWRHPPEVFRRHFYLQYIFKQMIYIASKSLRLAIANEWPNLYPVFDRFSWCENR
jgi:hypothetical protein